MSATQCLEINKIHGITIAHLLDDRLVEGNEIEDLAQELYGLIESDGRTKLILNLSSVEFISSAGLGKLVVLQKKMNARGGTLRFCCIRPEVYEVFAVTQLVRLFDIRESEADALAAFD
jgi:anti-sigma B factor antagonist